MAIVDGKGRGNGEGKMLPELIFGCLSGRRSRALACPQGGTGAWGSPRRLRRCYSCKSPPGRRRCCVSTSSRLKLSLRQVRASQVDTAGHQADGRGEAGERKGSRGGGSGKKRGLNVLSWGDVLLCVDPRGPGEVGRLGQHQGAAERRPEAGKAGRREEGEETADFSKEPRPT